MAIGFDQHNLQGAVQAVMASAASKKQTDVRSLDRSRRIDMTDAAEVQAHIMDRVEAAFAKASESGEGIEIARIEEVVYSPVGFVYELNSGEMHPPPLSRTGTGQEITHLAYFWATL